MPPALGFALAVAAILAPAASAKSFTHGVAASEITPSSALLWTRFPAPGVRLRVEVALDRRFRRIVQRQNAGAVSAARDRTVPVRVSSLRPATTYWYRFRVGRTSGAARSAGRRASTATGDDHEFINDFTRAEHGDAIFRAGIRAFLDYNPVT